MGGVDFSSRELKSLQKNPNVKAVEGSRIIYTDAFKSFYMRNYLAGKKPTAIFLEAGFDPSILGNKRIERASARWRQLYAEGNLSLDEPELQLRKRGRPRKYPEMPADLPKRKRGRPRKSLTPNQLSIDSELSLLTDVTTAITKILPAGNTGGVINPIKRKRGRPRKYPLPAQVTNADIIIPMLQGVITSVNDLVTEMRLLRRDLNKEK